VWWKRKTNNHINTEKEKKRKRRVNLLIVTIIAIILVTVFVFRYTHQTRTGGENYSVCVEVEDEVCNVTVAKILPSKLRIDIDSEKLYNGGVNYTVWVVKNVTFYVPQELESATEIGFEEKESSIVYWISLKNCSFSWAMITFFELYYSEERLGRDFLFQIVIREHFTSFFMQFETFKEDG